MSKKNAARKAMVIAAQCGSTARTAAGVAKDLGLKTIATQKPATPAAAR